MIHPFVILDAAMSAAAARSRLEHYRLPLVAAVRRREGLRAVWHVVPGEALVARLEGAADEEALGDLLGLAGRHPDEVCQVDELDRDALDEFTGVVLAGDDVVAVGWQEPRASAVGRGDGRPAGESAAAEAGPFELEEAGGLSEAESGPLSSIDLDDLLGEDEGAIDVGGGGAEPADGGLDDTRSGRVSVEGGDRRRRPSRTRGVARPARGSVDREAAASEGAGRSAEMHPPPSDEGGPSAELRPPPNDDGGPALRGPEPTLSFPPYPRLEAPRQVAAGEAFVLRIGLAVLRQAEVLGDRMDVPVEEDGRSFALDLQVVADGFAAPEGWRHRIAGTVERFTEAEAVVPLVAPQRQDDAFRVSSLVVHFSHRGNHLGTAWRNLLVRAVDAPAVSPDDLQPLAEDDAAAPLAASAPGSASDLTVTLAKPDRDPGGGHFLMTFESPHPVDLPAEPLDVRLGDDAKTFAKTCVEQIEQNQGSPLLNNVFRTIGRDFIADKLPDGFWTVLRSVAAAVRATEQRETTVLWLSAESHVPWELAWMDPPLDAARPPLLGAQVAFGRWILGRRGPPAPPRDRVEVRSMAVVVGDYAHSMRWRPLPHAVEEGEALVDRYQARKLEASVDDLDALFEARLPGESAGAEAVHFACHGKADPTKLEYAAIILAPDGKPLNFIAVGADRLGEDYAPFVFLNACQVGASGDLLDLYAGFAGVFLRSGARAFLAPFWSVKDEVAHDTALELYRSAFAGRPVAEFLREVRGRARLEAGEIPEATHLAYVFYGHPRLLLSRVVQEGNGP